MQPVLPPSLSRYSPRRAFTLAELLVVMAIIAIVIALIVPALGGSRNAARASATSNLMKQISNAVAVFGNENSGQMPGPFTARQMGMASNETQGMSMAENVMLGLMGWSSSGSGTPLAVGPSPTTTITVNSDMIGVPGADGKQYFTPDKKYYVPQYANLSQQVGVAPHTDAEGQPQLPDIVDAWGTPLLFWVSDDTYISKPSATNPGNYKFALRNSGTGTTGAKYYWASNSCFLTAQSVGKRALNQFSGSLLATAPGNTSPVSLEGVLGNPNAPWRNPSQPNDVPQLPLSGRSPFMVQSAGIDGYYLGKQDKGAKLFAGGIITYGTNFAPSGTGQVGPTNQYLDKNGKQTNIDIMSDFDDLWSNSGS